MKPFFDLALERFFSFNRTWAIPLLLLTTGLILFLTLMPSHKLWPSTLWSYDKLGHAGLFFGWTWNLLVWTSAHEPDRKVLVRAFLACLLFGGSIETLQHVLPINRSADFIDLLADLSGGALALFLFTRFLPAGNTSMR